MRSDLEEQLRAVGLFFDDDAAVAWDRGDDSDSFIDVGSAPRPRWRALGAVAAVLVLLGVASVVWIRSGQELATSSGVMIPPDWRRVNDLSGLDAQPLPATMTTVDPVDVVWADRGWVAVGQTGTNERTSGAVWTSGDGQKWERVVSDVFAGDLVDGERRSTTLVGVASRDSDVLAVGTQTEGRSSQPFVVRSTDSGRRWERVLLPETGPEGDEWFLTSVAAGPIGFLITGTGDAGVASWVSDNGNDWSFSFVDDPGSNITSATVTDEGFLAGGSIDYRFAAAWSSDDGLDWQRSTFPEAGPGAMYSSEVSQVISNAETAIALVSRRSVSAGVTVDDSGGITITGPAGLEAWHSVNGTSWAQSIGPSVATPLLNSAVETAPGLVVLSSVIPAMASDSGFLALVWTADVNRIELVELYSLDGITWASRPAPQAKTSPVAIAARPGGLLCLGQAGNPYTSRKLGQSHETVVWTAI